MADEEMNNEESAVSSLPESDDKGSFGAADTKGTRSGPEPDIDVQKADSKPVLKKSTRDHLTDALKSVKEREGGDSENKLQTHKKPEKNVSPENKTAAPAEKPIDAPISWKADKKAEFAKLPRATQEYIAQRESEMERKISSNDDERQFGRSIRSVMDPYRPLFAMTNQTYEGGIREMLNMAQIFQMGNAAQKANLVHHLIQRWGIDMKITPEETAKPENQLAFLKSELVKTQEKLNNLPRTLQAEQVRVHNKSLIDAFRDDPKNVHFEKVRPFMAALLTGGQAKDLQDAYDKACYADPEIRPLLVKAQQDAADKERVAKKQAEAEKARKAGASVKGTGGINGVSPSPKIKRTLKEDLRAAFREAVSNQ